MVTKKPKPPKPPSLPASSLPLLLRQIDSTFDDVRANRCRACQGPIDAEQHCTHTAECLFIYCRGLLLGVL